MHSTLDIYLITFSAISLVWAVFISAFCVDCYIGGNPDTNIAMTMTFWSWLAAIALTVLALTVG